jgi:hypothetical protein
MNQLLIGAAIPFAIAAAAYALRGGRASWRWLILTPAAMALGALWAVVPDLPRLVGWYSLYHRLAQDPRCDVFFWHYTIDRLEADSSWYAAGWVVLAAGLLAAALRELYRAEASDPPSSRQT